MKRKRESPPRGNKRRKFESELNIIYSTENQNLERRDLRNQYHEVTQKDRNENTIMGKSINFEEYLENRKKKRESIPYSIVSDKVFTKSPKKQRSNAFVYDQIEVNKMFGVSKTKDEEYNKERKGTIEKKEKIKVEEGDADQESKERQQEKTKNPFETFTGPQKLKEFEKEIEFKGQKLLEGEGQAMTDFLRLDKRIPRRGELLEEDKIKELESLGYVMSGSRHKRMNMVRERKEMAVKTIYEKYKIDMDMYMQNQKREMGIQSKLNNLVENQKRRFISKKK